VVLLKIDNMNSIVQNMNAFAKANTEETDDTVKGISFGDTLKEKLDEVNADQLEADAVTEAFLKGDDVDIHEVMIATEEAKQSLQMAVQVRNKLVEAFQEINRMQL
jgi:flagellar hook-basal body complex protein FliE